MPNGAGKVVVTLCIGSQNLQANPELRGKCVEKTCSPNSNEDCKVRGRVGVFQQYAELASANMFDADDAGKKSHSMKAVEPPDPAKVATEAPAPNPGEVRTAKGASAIPASGDAALPKVPQRKDLSKSGKGMSLKSTASPGWPKAASSVEWPKARERVAFSNTRERAPSSNTIVRTSAPVRESGEAMKLVLRPARSSRAPASVADGMTSKRVCVAKSNMTAPANLRGKCAVRTCLKGKCNYQGKKDMFDRIAAQASGDELLD